MKTLVTHRFPHLDDIAAIWLWQRYVPGFKKAKIGFVDLIGGGAAVTWKNKPVDSSKDIIHFGVGRGKFDEHKGDVGKSATLLVHEELLRRKLIPKSELGAIAKLVDFVNLEDTGRVNFAVRQDLYLPSLLRRIEPSEHRYEIGAELLLAALPIYQNRAQVEKDWKTGQEFETCWGKAMAIKTVADGPDYYGYQKGFVLLVHFDPKRNWRMFRAAAESSVDLTKVYQELHRLEPSAGWYLHQSKHMLMCGSRSAPDVVRSKLSLKKLIEITKTAS